MFKGYVLGWSAPTYVSPKAFEEALHHCGGYDPNSVYMYHANTFASRVNARVRQRPDAGVFARQVGRDGDGNILFALVLERKLPQSLETYPDVVFRLPIEFRNPAEIILVDHRFPLTRQELELELESVRQLVPSASVLARLARTITRRGAVALRKGGGAYFIPSAMQELVDQVENTVFVLGGDTMKFAVTGQDYELKTIFDSLRDQFGVMVAQLRMRAAQAKRERTKENVQRELAGLIDTVSVYRDILGSYASQLDIIFETAKRSIIESLSIQPVQSAKLSDHSGDDPVVRQSSLFDEKELKLVQEVCRGIRTA